MKFKDYQTPVTLTVRPDSIAYELLNTYGISSYYADEQVYGEALLDALKHSTLGDFDDNKSGFIRALEYLNRKLEAARKTISFWDAYQIRETVEDKEHLLGQLSNLPVNSSVVSNLRIPFTWFNELNKPETVYRGDLFVKDYDGRVHLIHGISQGSYQPRTIWEPLGENATTYQLVYDYTEHAARSVTTSITIGETEPQGYNATNSINAFASSVVLADVVNANIPPVVKYYLQDSLGGLELVMFDEVYKITNNKIYGNNPTSLSLVYEVK